MPNWFDENESRTFPFLASFQEAEASFAPASMALLPNSAIVDFGAVAGVLSFYEEDSHHIYLYRVERVDDEFVFEFRSTAPALADYALTFRRDVTTTEFTTEYANVEAASPDASASDQSLCPTDDSLLEGYLVTGDLSELADVLPTSGDLLLGNDDEAVIEPALIRSLVSNVVRTVNLANADRTRATNPENCIQPTLEFTQQPIYVNQTCLLGTLKFEAGYNTNIVLGLSDNSLAFSGEVGGGAGEPCEEIPLFDGEEPPAGRTLLDGADGCNEVIRSINGAGGRVFNILGGLGVSVQPDPENHRVIVDIDLNNMAACFQGSEPSEICPPDPDTSLCGDL